VALTDHRAGGMTMAEPDAVAGRRGFRPGARRRSRIALGVALAAIAIAGNLVVYTSLDRRTEVLQVVRDVPAGTQLAADDVRHVEISADPTVRTVPADRLGAIVGQYTKVRLVAGSLVVTESLQVDPLVTPGSAVVAVQVPEGSLPVGIREGSRVQLVVPPARSGEARPGEDGGALVVDGWVVGLPTSTQSVTGRVSLSVEVDEAIAAVVAAGDDVRVVLVAPTAGTGS
jgi:hypothetical protein